MKLLQPIQDEPRALKLARLRSHEDMAALMDYLREQEVHAIKRFRGETEYEVLVVWSTVLQVLGDIGEMCANAHDNWQRIREAEANAKNQVKWRE